MRWWCASAALVVVAACASVGTWSEDEVAERFASSLQVQVQGDSVRFVLAVTNVTDSALSLDFPTGQRYDFVVVTPGGAEVWRWSADRMFTQALGSVELGPGETVTYSEVWTPGARTGEYVARGIVPARNARIEQSTTFQLSE